MAFSPQFIAVEPARDEVDALAGPVVVEFGAPWCGHCQAALPLIEAAFAGYPQVQHLKVEDGRARPLGRSFRIKLWPTLVFLRDGVEVARLLRPTDPVAIAEALARVAA